MLPDLRAVVLFPGRSMSTPLVDRPSAIVFHVRNIVVGVCVNNLQRIATNILYKFFLFLYSYAMLLERVSVCVEKFFYVDRNPLCASVSKVWVLSIEHALQDCYA